MKLRTNLAISSNVFFEKSRQELQLALKSSAFRRGTSAFRFGLIQAGVSDHLPFVAKVKHSGQTELNLMSWNLLADAHLYNNFMNISGSEHLAALIKDAHPDGNVYYQKDNKLFYFFAELARFLYKNQFQEKINITRELLLDFVSTQNAPSNLARSRDIQVALEKTKQVEAARLQIVTILIQEMNFDSAEKPTQSASELRLAVQHSLELIHHIENSDGTLLWVNRFARIKRNQPLIARIASMDFLCLQECTKPNDIRDLLSAQETKHAVISYGIDNSSDHAVLIYDAEKFELIGEPLKYALEGKKPAIFAKFKKLDTNEVLVIASIHHPGGKHNLMKDILQQVELLRGDVHASVPFYILGDYNHTHEFFQANVVDVTSHHMIYPEAGTMAGSDYGNVNKAIDAIATNQPAENITVRLVDELPVSPPAPALPVAIVFAAKGGVANLGIFKLTNQAQTSVKTDAVHEVMNLKHHFAA
jgi:hypothetical protein